MLYIKTHVDVLLRCTREKIVYLEVVFYYIPIHYTPTTTTTPTIVLISVTMYLHLRNRIRKCAEDQDASLSMPKVTNPNADDNNNIISNW